MHDIAATYNLALLAICAFISIICCYAVLEIAERSVNTERSGKNLWLWVGGLSFGFSNWILHVITLLALEVPFPIAYDYAKTLLSFSVIMIVSFIPFLLIARPAYRKIHMFAGTVILWAGLMLMFYFNMQSMLLKVKLTFNPNYAIIACFAAFATAISTLALFQYVRNPAHTGKSGKWLLSLFLGLIMTLTHFSGVAAIDFNSPGAPVLFSHPGISKTPVIWASGLSMIIILLLAVLNLAERRSAQKEYAQLNIRTQLILKSAEEGILGMDRDGFITFCNPAALRMLGYEMHEVIGKIPLTIFQKDGSGNLEGWPARPPLWQTLKLGAILHEKDTLLVRKDGVEIPVEYISTPIIEKGTIGGAIVTFKDISVQKQAEENLKSSEAKYRSLVETATDAILILDTETSILSWNMGALQIFGYEEEEAIGKKLGHLIWPDSRVDYIEWIREFRSSAEVGGIHRSIELNAVKKSGTVFPVEMSITSWKSQDEMFFNAVIRDITERKQTQELYQNSEKLAVLGQLAAGIAHEIRNPLTSIRGFIQLLKARSNENENYYAIILSELDRINFIVSEFLLLAKPQAVEFSEHDLKSTLSDVITLLDTQAILNKTQIELICELDEVPIQCVETHLKQVFINLLKNAIESMPSGGTVTISIEPESHDKVLIKFADQGGGIDPELVPQLGEPFYTTKEKGTGLGLMVSFKIIKDHGGTIDIKSALGRGTTVSITLPLKEGGLKEASG